MGRKRQGPLPSVPERNRQFARHLLYRLGERPSMVRSRDVVFGILPGSAAATLGSDRGSVLEEGGHLARCNEASHLTRMSRQVLFL